MLWRGGRLGGGSSGGIGGAGVKGENTSWTSPTTVGVDDYAHGSFLTVDIQRPPASMAPAVIAVGVPGATGYGYIIIGYAADGGIIANATAAGTIVNGNAVLSAVNYNNITWAAVPGAVSYAVFRNTVYAGTNGIIGTTTGLVLNDTGLVGDNSTYPDATAGMLKFFDEAGGDYHSIIGPPIISAPFRATLPPDRPIVGQGLVASNVSGPDVTFAWGTTVVYRSKVLTGGVATPFLDVEMTPSTARSGHLIYEVVAYNDASPTQWNIVCGDLAFTSINQGGVTLFTNTADRQDSNVESNATVLTVAFDYVNVVASDKITLRANAASTLAGVVAYTLRYQIVGSRALTVTEV